MTQFLNVTIPVIITLKYEIWYTEIITYINSADHSVKINQAQGMQMLRVSNWILSYLLRSMNRAEYDSRFIRN
jgi:hypothetical protein